MTVVRPFCAVRYDLDRVELSRVIVPPYDVVAVDERSLFFDRDPHNAIRLELTPTPEDEADTDYSEVRETLSSWLGSGVLIQDPTPGYYVMKQSFTAPDGTHLERIGFYAELGLEEYDRRVVLPHERTLAGPRADRLKLLRATRANLSSVFLLYEDREDMLGEILASAFGSAGRVLGAARDDAGVSYELARLEAPDAIAALGNWMADHACVIADGHHRYETALQYRRERREEIGDGADAAPFDSTLAFFANAYAPGSLLLPIHRVVKNVTAPSPVEWAERLPGWTCRTLEAPDDDRAAAALATETLAKCGDRAAFVADAGNGEFCVLTRREPLAEALMVEVLERDVIGAVLGLSLEDIRNGEVLFPKTAERAARSVREGEGNVALYLNPLLPDDVFRVTGRGEVMPQKSTFFYPKIPTGMTFRVHAESP
jgi:uncharacterized protein (DUF1015 family)